MDAIPQHAVALPVPLITLLADSGLCQSKSDARRQIRGGAVKVAGEKVESEDFELSADHLDAEGFVLVSRGKKKKLRVCAG